MRLTMLTDYALRLLMLAQAAGDRLVTIEEATRRYGVSRGHMMKVANVLTRAGILVAVRGRSGGLRLAHPPEEIRLGAVVRATEPDFALVECYTTGNGCAITGTCRLPRILNAGLAAFVAALDQYTLADLRHSADALMLDSVPPGGARHPDA
ncbi:Rrf2 family transcriptional regulator [Rhabdaerophilum calidifontis]|uniref:Rrf2 family transcriptional regulator n=1 Tax=Rhabdaerophilum calidifontis TaxID=2604328 RepID=UPI00123C6085|nr:Rrf2 family transcriptional regulator [Rhabdaerophilum calidifontis]